MKKILTNCDTFAIIQIKVRFNDKQKLFPSTENAFGKERELCDEGCPEEKEKMGFH